MNMPKPVATKSKPPPWIPPGKSSQKPRKPVKPVVKSKGEDFNETRNSAETTFVIQGKDERDNEPDIMSVSSNSSDTKNEANIYMFSIFQEMKLLYIHFASLKTSYLSAHRLIDFQNIEDTSIKELLNEIESFIKDMTNLFEDLEYSVCVLENTMNDERKVQHYSEVYKHKERLFSKLFELYEKLIIIFHTVFEKLDFKEMSQLQESLKRKLQVSEKKCISQEAIIKDLERRLSILQSKTNSMEDYKTNLESAKSELEKQLLHKDSQIKYLSNELLNASRNQTKTGHEDLIEIIEEIKSKAHNDKSALKKALKFQKTHSEEMREKYKKLSQESIEKEKVMFDIATQRDQLKVQLTIVNNDLIQRKTQIEEMKNQNLKLQNEMTEKDASYKKEISSLKDLLEEKSSSLGTILKAKKNLETTIEELENELQTAKNQFKNLKKETQNIESTNLQKSKETDVMYQEMHHLVSLLQNIKEMFENLKLSTHVISSGGDSATNQAILDSVGNEILIAVKEIKEHLLELRNLYKALLEEQEHSKAIQVHPKKNAYEKQLKEIEKLYSESLKENQSLKAEVEELKNISLASTTAKKTENLLAENISSDNFTRNLQFELMKKTNEIVKLKYDFKQKERELEDQLKGNKDKFKTLEVDSLKITNLEDELRSTKQELSLVLQKKEEEAERFLRRTRELEDSLDLKNAECESLQRYVQMLRLTYDKVFGS